MIDKPAENDQQLLYGKLYLADLALYHRLLSLHGKGDFLELRVSDNDRIIIARRYSGTEFFPVGRLKIFLCCRKDICAGIEPQENRGNMTGRT